MTALCLILLAIVPREDIAADQCDVFLYEHYHDSEGRLVFTQLCPLDWNPHQERWDYVTWRIAKFHGDLRPERDRVHGGWVVRFLDGETPRVIRAHAFREEWTQADSEMEARVLLPKDKRRGLYVRPKETICN